MESTTSSINLNTESTLGNSEMKAMETKPLVNVQSEIPLSPQLDSSIKSIDIDTPTASPKDIKVSSTVSSMGMDSPITITDNSTTIKKTYDGAKEKVKEFIKNHEEAIASIVVILLTIIIVLIIVSIVKTIRRKRSEKKEEKKEEEKKEEKQE